MPSAGTLAALLACLIPLAAPRAGESPMTFPTAEWATSIPEDQGLDRARLDQAMAGIQALCGTDGNRQTVVIRNGYLLWQGDEAGKRHLVWSCTKSFMSTCLGLLWDDGICAPDTLASRYLPALAADYPTVTLAQLASFTSGYAHAERRPDVPAKPLYQPGAAFDYSSQSDLLAVLLTAAAGEPLHDLFMRRIGAPIGLDDQEFRWGAQALPGPVAVNGGAGAAGSGVELTARAMARFGWLYCRRGDWNGRRLISTRYIDAATTVRVPASIPPYDAKAWYVDVPGRYGLNWWVNGVAANGKRLWPSVPASAFAAQGNKNNICIIVPDWNLVLVRLGEDEIIDVSLFDGPLRLLGEGLRLAGGLPSTTP